VRYCIYYRFVLCLTLFRLPRFSVEGASHPPNPPTPPAYTDLYEQALVSLKLKKSIGAEGGRTFAVIIEGG